MILLKKGDVLLVCSGCQYTNYYNQTGEIMQHYREKFTFLT